MPVDFLQKTYKYTNNHTCVPNGLGDFDLICSEYGKVRFVPCFMHSMIKCDCPLCGKRIESVDKE
jgi:hypothetical protein